MSRALSDTGFHCSFSALSVYQEIVRTSGLQIFINFLNDRVSARTVKGILSSPETFYLLPSLETCVVIFNKRTDSVKMAYLYYKNIPSFNNKNKKRSYLDAARGTMKEQGIGSSRELLQAIVNIYFYRLTIFEDEYCAAAGNFDDWKLFNKFFNRESLYTYVCNKIKAIVKNNNLHIESGNRKANAHTERFLNSWIGHLESQRDTIFTFVCVWRRARNGTEPALYSLGSLPRNVVQMIVGMMYL